MVHALGICRRDEEGRGEGRRGEKRAKKVLARSERRRHHTKMDGEDGLRAVVDWGERGGENIEGDGESSGEKAVVMTEDT
jgi:hypothetical protein